MTQEPITPFKYAQKADELKEKTKKDAIVNASSTLENLKPKPKTSSSVKNFFLRFFK